MAKKPVLHWPDPILDGTHTTGSTLQYNIQLHSSQKITFWPPRSPFSKTFEKNLALLKFCFGRSSAKFWKINFLQKRYPWGIAKTQLFCFQMFFPMWAHHGNIAQVIPFVTFSVFFPLLEWSHMWSCLVQCTALAHEVCVGLYPNCSLCAGWIIEI